MIKEYQPSDSDPDSESLQNIVAARRAKLSRTIDQIEHELRPSRLIEKGLDESTDVAIKHLKERTEKMAATAVAKLKDNPWPLLLIGAGVALWLSSSKKDAETKNH